MARTAITAQLTAGSSTFTVPSGKTFVGSANCASNASTQSVNVNGVPAGYTFSTSGGQQVKPLCANGGDVISSGAGSFSLNGFLYDA